MQQSGRETQEHSLSLSPAWRQESLAQQTHRGDGGGSIMLLFPLHPSICQRLHRSHLPSDQEHTHRPHRRWSRQKVEQTDGAQEAEETGSGGGRWREVENESVGLSSGEQQQQQQTLKTPSDRGTAEGGGAARGEATPPNSQSQLSVLAVMSSSH